MGSFFNASVIIIFRIIDKMCCKFTTQEISTIWNFFILKHILLIPFSSLCHLIFCPFSFITEIKNKIDHHRVSKLFAWLTLSYVYMVSFHCYVIQLIWNFCVVSAEALELSNWEMSKDLHRPQEFEILHFFHLFCDKWEIHCKRFWRSLFILVGIAKQENSSEIGRSHWYCYISFMSP